MFGFTDNYIRVNTQYDPLLVNEIVDVQLTAIDADGDMLGEPQDKSNQAILTHESIQSFNK